MDLLEQAIQLAVQAHHGQRDKVGQPYILHPLRVMLRMETDWERIVAVLHDVVEDSDCTLQRLQDAGFPADVVTAVDCLTKREGEDYDTFIQRAKSNPIARRVKMADLEDNLDQSRLPRVTEADHKRLEKYQRALAGLREAGTDCAARRREKGEMFAEAHAEGDRPPNLPAPKRYPGPDDEAKETEAMRQGLEEIKARRSQATT